MIGCAFYKFDAGEVFPMAHSLLKKGFVSTRKIGVDLVRDDSKVPDAFLARRSGPSGADQRLVVGLSDLTFALIPFNLGGRFSLGPLCRSVIVGIKRFLLQLKELVFQFALLATSKKNR